MKRIPKSFFTKKDTLQTAQQLLGKVLCSQFGPTITKGIIVETEAYIGPKDKACHAYNNRYTERTKTMFEEGGHAYIYLCYGIHHLFNIVTSIKGAPEAVLIRAIEPIQGIDIMMERRNINDPIPRLCAGPGTLSQAMGITTKSNGINMLHADSPIWLEDHHISYLNPEIIASRRIGVSYAGEDALLDWRFRVKTSRWTSKAKGLGE